MEKVYIWTTKEGLKDTAKVRRIGEEHMARKEEQRLIEVYIYSYVLENQEAIATAACLDSGKTKVDAILGEILVTVEKLQWTIKHGEKALRPERRPTNFLMMYKHNEVRWEPLGVVAACVSWKYASPKSILSLYKR